MCSGFDFFSIRYRQMSLEDGGEAFRKNHNLIGKEFKFKTISQGDFGHFRENKSIILSKVAKIALRDCF